MLARLSIRDIVLIERLDIDFAAGLSVLTGETGAGKSILLDAFALALGARGDAALVRQLFGLRPAPEFAAWLEQRGIFRDGRLAPGAALEGPTRLLTLREVLPG